MSATEARYHLLRLKRKYSMIRLMEVLLLALAAGLITYGVAYWFVLPVSILWLLTGAAVLGCFIVRSIQLGLWQISEAGVVHYMNQHYPQLEESADLFTREDEELTSLQQLQKIKSLRQFEILYPSVKLPHKLLQALGIFAFSALLSFVSMGFAGNHKVSGETALHSSDAQPGPSEKEVLPAAIRSAAITFTPPSYTGIPRQTVKTFNLHVPEGTNVQWSIAFTEKVLDAKMIFSTHDSVKLTVTASGEYSIQRQFAETAFYQIAWKNEDGSAKYSDYFTVETIRDQPPVITIENLDQFITLSLTDKLKINLQSTLTDDYHVNDAYIIATVSKGSGESVKFREEKLRFDKPDKISGKSLRASRTIDLIKLGLDPGDELYFYVEALDNKAPQPNKARTETFFIALQDTTQQTTSIDPGLGVDLMPDYFRSQRQIIIDSEKLLKEKKNITKEAFNSRSNELAYDQKVLRLRYGEFLGEEFESGIGPQAAGPSDDHGEEDVTKAYGHVHDTENEHNLVEEKKSAPAQDHHDHGGDDKDDPVKAYTHAHDSEDEATFFAQSIRSKLKAAITVMWDAELHLRLYDPEKSLPYQYKALKLLKEISQDSRIYVHRTGFDPPPLKEEKRLTGDLTELKNATAEKSTSKPETYPHIRKAAALLEHMLQSGKVTITPDIKNDLLKAGQELSAVAIAQPGRYLKSLSLLKRLSENEIEPAQQPAAIEALRASLWQVLPQEAASPQSHTRSVHALDERFLKSMEALKQK
ncbi:MAG TPA: hypothetical protein VIU12_26125 [Chryseolinea sp.]